MHSGQGDLIPRTQGEHPLVKSPGSLLDLIQFLELGVKASGELLHLLASVGEVSVCPREVSLGAKVGRAERGELVGCDVEGLASFGSEGHIVAADVED